MDQEEEENRHHMPLRVRRRTGQDVAQIEILIKTLIKEVQIPPAPHPSVAPPPPLPPVVPVVVNYLKEMTVFITRLKDFDRLLEDAGSRSVSVLICFETETRARLSSLTDTRLSFENKKPQTLSQSWHEFCNLVACIFLC